MRILMVGAGCVGAVLSRFLEVTKGNELTYYVRPGRRAELGRVKLIDARSGEVHVRERPSAIEAGREPIPRVDTAILAVRAEQLDEALALLEQLPPEVRIASAGAGFDDVARIRQRFPGRIVVHVQPTFVAYRDGDAIRWWNPPLARTLVSWDDDEAARPFAEELAKDLQFGGLPARPMRSVRGPRDAAFAAGMPLVASLELAGWDWGAWAESAELRGLASGALREGLRAIAPPVAGRLLGLWPGALLSVALRAVPALAGRDIREMWRVHGPKLSGQTRHLLDALIARAEARATPSPSLHALRDRLKLAILRP